MKIKCPLLSCEGCLVDARICEGTDDCFISVEIPTADLITELERRRPCKRCEFKLDEYCECCWDGLNSKQDNFKEAK